MPGRTFVLAGSPAQYQQYLKARGIDPGSAVYLHRVEQLIGADAPRVIETGIGINFDLKREVQEQVKARNGEWKYDPY